MSGTADIEQLLNLVVDPVWYRARYPDVAASGLDAARHYLTAGLAEQRDPNRWFDGVWYLRQNPDAAASGANPLLHYLSIGAAEGRDPHPRFDTQWYLENHPGAAGNPLLFHLRAGAARGWMTEPPVAIAAWLPASANASTARVTVPVDIVIPVYRDLAVTQRCLASVLADGERPPGRIIVIDDRSPEPALRAWLTHLPGIVLLRNRKNLGFVASVNRGMKEAGDRDVVLLNSDTEVPSGWLRRLQDQAHAAPDIASVSPLSNNASICSYPGFEGGPMPAGMTLAGLDAACQAANAGRFVTTPTTVGFCMYIRRAALDAVGPFDAAAFGRGYGEENDFCLRASALGWTHRIACDIFVRHEGGVSFGTEADALTGRAMNTLLERYPDYRARIARHGAADAAAPYRFALTMAAFRASGLPVILLVAHEFAGGVRRHIDDIATFTAGRAHCLLLEAAARGIALSVPALPGHPRLTLAAERWRDVAAVARSAGVTRVHIHHLMGFDLDIQSLIHILGVPFDVTVHDYFAICPQVTLLPRPGGQYCGEPGLAGCDACIANRPSHGATDIVSWRLRWAWQFHAADRVFCPSQDALDRLARHGLAGRARLARHEATAPGPWPMRPKPMIRGKMRIAVPGSLADHKGAHTVAAVAMAMDPARFEIQLIGAPGPVFPPAALERIRVHGPYREGELPGLLARYRPHLVWFPASAPETHGFTLGAAIDAGLPIVASAIGAYPERLAGRPLTWLIPPEAGPEPWLAAFEAVRAAQSDKQSRVGAPRRAATGDWIGDIYLTPKAVDGFAAPSSSRTAPVSRSTARPSVLLIPEQFGAGWVSPCAHIRLLRPFSHDAIASGLAAVTMANAETALTVQADAIVTQRHAVPSLAAAEALTAHARRIGAALIYDLDDDLLSVPQEHPDAAALRPLGIVVEWMVRHADVVWTSTEVLAGRVAKLARAVRVVPNALDERIWLTAPPRPPDRFAPIGILCMGTATHDADFAAILPALTEIRRQFHGQVRIGVTGFVTGALPDWIAAVPPSVNASRSYPGFVHWFTRQTGWDIGLAPLADTPFNAAKSPIKLLDYAAAGLAVLASDVGPYRGALADGRGGQLVANTGDAWYGALSRLIRDDPHRRARAAGGVAWLRETGTLAVRAGAWRDAWPLPPVGVRRG